MGELFYSLALSAFSFLFGAVVTRWWNRARSLIVLQGFSTRLAGNKPFQVPQDLIQLSEESWSTNKLPQEVNLSTINDLLNSAKTTADDFDVAAEKLSSWRVSLEHALTDEDKRLIFREIMLNSGMRSALQDALLYEELEIEKYESQDNSCEQQGLQNPNQIAIELSDGDNGSYIIAWRRDYTSFAQGLKIYPFLKNRYEPFINILKYLDTKRMVEILKNIEPLMEKQARISRRIRDILNPAVEDNNQWAAKVLIVNYGGTPMIIWPEAVLNVRPKSTKERLKPIPCSIYIESTGEQPGVSPLEGVKALLPGEKAVIWVISVEPQRNIDGGKVLRTHYNEKDAEANVKLRIDKGGAWGRFITSKYANFSKSLAFPE